MILGPYILNETTSERRATVAEERRHARLRLLMIDYQKEFETRHGREPTLLEFSEQYPRQEWEMRFVELLGRKPSILEIREWESWHEQNPSLHLRLLREAEQAES